MSYVRALPKAASIAGLHTTHYALRLFDRYECRRILDVGCGDAYFEEAFPGRFVGLDIERSRVRQAGRRGVELLLVGDGEYLPLADAEFDGLVAKDVLEHLYLGQAFRFLHEARRVLRPGGIFVTVTFRNTQSFWDKPDHVRPYSNKWVNRVMTQEMGGFEVVWARDLSAGIPGFGRLRLEWLTHALAHYLKIRTDHGLICLRKTG